MSILLGRQRDTHPLQILVRFCALPGQLQGYQDEQETVLHDLNGKGQCLICISKPSEAQFKLVKTHHKPTYPNLHASEDNTVTDALLLPQGAQEGM